MPFEVPVYEHPEVGVYTFVIMKVEDGQPQEYGPTVIWYLFIKDPNKKGAYLLDSKGQPFEIRVMTSNRLSGRSRAGKIVKAVFGCELDLVNPETLYSDLEGGEFTSMLVINENGYPTISQDVAASNPKPFSPRLS